MQKKDKNNIFSWIALTMLFFLFPVLPQYVYIGGGLNISNLCGAISVVLLLLSGKIYKWHLSILMVPYFLYVGINIVRYYLEEGIFRMGAYAIICLVIPVLVVGFINSKTKFFKAIDLLIYSGMLMAILGVAEGIIRFNPIQLLANGETNTFFYDIRYGVLRVMGTFGQPISYGLYLMLIIALIIYRLNCRGISLRKRRVFRLCHILCIVGIILTVSRIPILACLILHMVLLFRGSKKRVINYLVVGIVVVISLITLCEVLNIRIIFISDFLDALESVFTGNNIRNVENGIGDRSSLWSWVFVSMNDSWIWGRGLLKDFAYDVYSWETKTSIENQYLNVLYHQGIVGLVTLALSYITTLIYSKKSDKKYKCAFGEKKLSFNKLVFVVFILYFICEFGVQETDMTRIYSIWIALLIAYNNIIRKGMKRGIQK